MSELARKSCVPCRGGVPPLTVEQIRPLIAEVPLWEVVGGTRLMREFRLRDFKSALDLVDRIGGMAEEQGHHPDLHLAWGKVRVEVFRGWISLT
jgi:4a-hydroxytetrahydrobiopterin dehydratase